MRKILFLFLILGTSSVAFAQEGPPCWDKIPPSEKYARKHFVSGDAISAPNPQAMHSLSGDGLTVRTSLIDGDAYLKVEVTVVNCSSQTVEVNPSEFTLTVIDVNGEKKLAPLDPTHIIQNVKWNRPFPALAPKTLTYGRIASFWLFFTKDDSRKSSRNGQIDYTLAMSLPVQAWQFDFTFLRKSH
jgi:hypothetical protein